MRCCALFILLACLALASSCAPLPPVPFSGQYSGANEAAYRLGYQKGFADGDAGRNEEYERHHAHYTVASEDAFKHGYDLGYEAGQDQADASDADRERARKEGYDAGRTDAENGSSPFYQRHRRNYRQKTETSFREGYVRGFNSARHHGSAD